MRYIGPFFRMNSLTQQEINGQLFYLSKESIKTIVLQSKCGLTSSIKNYSKNTSNIDITTNSNFSPLLCVYKKATPNFIHNKNSNGFDEDSFKKDLNPTTNALMTLCILELCDYYKSYENIDAFNFSLYEIYKNLSKDQLEFYSQNLRNNEGGFVDKKNILESNLKNFNLIDKNKKFKFSDQAFMMIAYYLYSIKNPNEEISKSYKAFALEILQMFVDFSEKIYECSLDELCKTLLALNIMYKYDNLSDLHSLIIDISDYVMNKFDEKDYYVDSLDTAALCSLNLTLSYKHTNIIAFLDKSSEILTKLASLYDADHEVFYKLSSKKEIKYSCLDITFYYLAFLVFESNSSEETIFKPMLLSIYRKFIINSGILPSWPDAPTLDDYERYRGLTLNSEDMIDESYFRMPNLPTPASVGMASVFTKSIVYNKRKDSFTPSKPSFDSYKNFLNFYLFIYLFKDDFIEDMKLGDRYMSKTSSIDLPSVPITEETPNDLTTTPSSENPLDVTESISNELISPISSLPPIVP